MKLSKQQIEEMLRDNQRRYEADQRKKQSNERTYQGNREAHAANEPRSSK